MNKQEQYDTLFRQFIHDLNLALEEHSAKVSGVNVPSCKIHISSTVTDFIQKIKESTWKETYNPDTMTDKEIEHRTMAIIMALLHPEKFKEQSHKFCEALKDYNIKIVPTLIPEDNLMRQFASDRDTNTPVIYVPVDVDFNSDDDRLSVAHELGHFLSKQEYSMRKYDTRHIWSMLKTETRAWKAGMRVYKERFGIPTEKGIKNAVFGLKSYYEHLHTGSKVTDSKIEKTLKKYLQG